MILSYYDLLAYHDIQLIMIYQIVIIYHLSFFLYLFPGQLGRIRQGFRYMLW